MKTQIHRLRVIDAIFLGNKWPNLQALLKVESSRDILLSLLTPTIAQKQALIDSDSWIMEAKKLLLACLGMKLVTQVKNWQFISEELWRFILFSEFVFNIQEGVPESLSIVPFATESARILVEDICDQIRNDRRTQALYIDNAKIVEKDFSLPEHCKAIKIYGSRNTFPFKEKFFLEQALKAFNQENTDIVRGIIKKSLRTRCGVGKGKARQNGSLYKLLSTFN